MLSTLWHEGGSDETAAEVGVLAFAVLIVIVVIANASGGEDKTKATVGATPASEAVTTVPAAATETTPVTSSSSDESNIDKATTEGLTKYLYENYGGIGDPKYKTSWYDSIKKIEVRYDKSINARNERSFYVWTDYYPDSEGKQAAKELLPAFLGFFNDATNNYLRLGSATIYGQNEHPLYSGIGGVDFPTK